MYVYVYIGSGKRLRRNSGDTCTPALRSCSYRRGMQQAATAEAPQQAHLQQGQQRRTAYSLCCPCCRQGRAEAFSSYSRGAQQATLQQKLCGVRLCCPARCTPLL